MSAVEKYLSRYAEEEVRYLAGWPPGFAYQHCVVIPVYDEETHFAERLLPLLASNHALGIIVINRPDNRAECDANESLRIWLQQRLPRIHWRNGPLLLLGDDHSELLLVDRDLKPIPRKQGVGLARKIGADLACLLSLQGHLSCSWIHNTDADAHLPASYFKASLAVADHSAISYAFEHIRDNSAISHATALYEQTLHHYRNGLQRAGSPYAFYTLGSTLAFDVKRYAQVRGFPKRAGGEDFYLLNKLAKLAPVKSLKEPVIRLEPRLSHRVPFGTGPAAQKIQEQGEVLSYATEIFDALKEWLTYVERHRYVAGSLERYQSELSPPVQSTLADLDVNSLYRHLQKHPGEAHFHSWFDAFRTLKFVHYLQAQHFPAQRLLITAPP
jgi:hypothetical protein